MIESREELGRKLVEEYETHKADESALGRQRQAGL